MIKYEKEIDYVGEAPKTMLNSRQVHDRAYEETHRLPRHATPSNTPTSKDHHHKLR